jgi:hypothetical protein
MHIPSTGKGQLIGIALLCCFLFAGCQPRYEFQDTPFAETVSEAEHARASAPIVIVGVITGDKPVGETRKSHWDPKMYVRLHKVTVDVENVLRGNLQTGNHDVYEFYIASTYTGPPTLGSPFRKYRGVYRTMMYLRREGGLLRTVCDGINRCVYEVGSGARLGYRPDPHQPLEAAVAYIFLTKGTGVTDLQFADSVEWDISKVPSNYAVPTKGYDR